MTVMNTDQEPPLATSDAHSIVGELVRALQEDMHGANYNGDLTHFTQQKPVSGRYYLKAIENGKVGLIPDAFFGDVVEMVSWMVCKTEEQRISSRSFDETLRLVLVGADMERFNVRKEALSSFFVALRELNTSEQPVAIDAYNDLSVHAPPEPKQKSKKHRSKRDMAPPMRRKRAEEEDVDPFEVDREWYAERACSEQRLAAAQLMVDSQEEMRDMHEQCDSAPRVATVAELSSPDERVCDGGAELPVENPVIVSEETDDADDARQPAPIAATGMYKTRNRTGDYVRTGATPAHRNPLVLPNRWAVGCARTGPDALPLCYRNR